MTFNRFLILSTRLLLESVEKREKNLKVVISYYAKENSRLRCQDNYDANIMQKRTVYCDGKTIMMQILCKKEQHTATARQVLCKYYAKQTADCDGKTIMMQILCKEEHQTWQDSKMILKPSVYRCACLPVCVSLCVLRHACVSIPTYHTEIPYMRVRKYHMYMHTYACTRKYTHTYITYTRNIHTHTYIHTYT
jgi:hypothetical protein